MPANYKKELFDLPGVLRDFLAQGSVEYARLARGVRWGGAPLFLISASRPVGLSAALTSEYLCEWPSQAYTPEEFAAYAMPLVQPRTLLLFISDDKDGESVFELAKAAGSRGAVIVVLSPSGDAPLTKLADTVFVLPSGSSPSHGAARIVSQEFALKYLVLNAARASKKPRPEWNTIESELNDFPSHLERSLAAMGEGVKSFASELIKADFIRAIGGGFYYPVCLHAAAAFEQSSGRIHAGALNATDSVTAPAAADQEIWLAISGSRCRVKKLVIERVEQARKAHTKILAVTDGSDPELSRRATMALLLPTLHEVTSSLHALVVLGWISHSLPRAEARKQPLIPPSALPRVP